MACGLRGVDRQVGPGAQERALLAPLRAGADLTIDTSELAIGDLKHLLQGHFAFERAGAAIAVLSFSYRQGLPREADLVFDARFLRNPHYEPTLRPLSGRDRAAFPDVRLPMRRLRLAAWPQSLGR